MTQTHLREGVGSPNSRLIEMLYQAIGSNNPAAAECYAFEAHFHDIAFDLQGRQAIGEMWRFVCHAKTEVQIGAIRADDRQGTGHWIARYIFSKTGRLVVNKIQSRFEFQDGLIVHHRDESDARAWADQAFPFPSNLFARIGAFRRAAARRELRKFLDKEGGSEER